LVQWAKTLLKVKNKIEKVYLTVQQISLQIRDLLLATLQDSICGHFDA
jgi:hypothetical protein